MIITRRVYNATNWIPESSEIVKVADSWKELFREWGTNIAEIQENWYNEKYERLRYTDIECLVHGELLAWGGAGWYQLVRISVDLEIFQLISDDLQRYPFSKECPNVDNSIVIRLETKPL